MNVKPKSRKEMRESRRKENFVGRGDQLRQFEENFRRHDPIMAFSVTGEGGVGKSTLLKQFGNIAKQQNAMFVTCDDTHTSPAYAMGHIAEKLAELKITLNAFDERYKEYRKLRQEVEGDPKAPRGAIDLIARSTSDFAIKSARRIPGASPFLEHVDEKAAGETLSQFFNYAIDRWGNKDEVRLLREPEKILTPLFLELLAKVTENRRLVLMFDVFERTSDSLESWLLKLFDFEYGDFNTNLIFVIAGREKLEQHWTEMVGDLCHMPLEPFTHEETREYLNTRGITDDQLVEQIHEDTGGLAVLVELLAATNPQPDLPLPDVSKDAVERFLQWTPQEDRRQAALLAAVPRQFDLDIVSAALGSDANANFGWLSSQSYIRSNTERGWFYHDKLRELMLRHLKNTFPRLLTDTHTRLADYFANQQTELKLEGKAAYESETWCKLERERVYHIISAKPDQNQHEAVNAFLHAFRWRWGFAEEIANCCQQSGREKNSQTIRDLANTLSEIYRAYDQDEYRVVTEKFGLLERRNDLTKIARCEIHAERGRIYSLEEKYNEALADLNLAIEFDEKYDWAIARRGETFRSMGKYEEALADFNRAIELEEEDAWTITVRGMTFRLVNKYEEALADFNCAIELDGKEAWAIAQRGETYRLMGKYEEALADFNRAIELDEKDDWAIASRGDTYRLMGKYEEALADFTRAIQLNEKYTWAITNRGETYRLTGKHEEALADFSRAIELDEKDAWTIAIRGETYQDMGKYEEALADFNRAIELEEKYAWAITNRGETFRLTEKYEEALADFNRAIELEEKHAWAMASRGETYRDLGKYEEALADFNRAIELDEKYAWAIGQRGETYLVMDKYEEALADFNRAIELDEKEASTIASRGEAYRRMKKYEEALANFNYAIELDGKNDEAILGRGETYRQMEKYEKALADFNHAIELDKKNAWAIASRGQTYQAIGKYEESLADFNRAIELDEMLDWAIAERGDTYWLLGKFENALADYRLATQMDLEQTSAHLGLIGCYRKLGMSDEYQHQVEITQEMFVKESEYNRACFAAIAGNVDEALVLLRTALEKSEVPMNWVRHNPGFDWIRDDSRFIALLEEMAVRPAPFGKQRGTP